MTKETLKFAVEALKAGMDRQHETAEQYGEVECTEDTPCVFCLALAEIGATEAIDFSV